MLAGVILLSLNLRPAAVSVGPVLSEVQHYFGMDAATAGVLTSMPVLAFAAFGALAPAAARRVGVHRAMFLALLALVVGIAARATTGLESVFLAFSMVALAGMAVANVLMPSLVKLHFPNQVGRVTALYTTALTVGQAAALVLTVPVSEHFGSWRTGLGGWTFPALVAIVLWLFLIAHDQRNIARPRSVEFSAVARTPLGWAMAGFFGLQSLQAYAIYGWFAQLWRDSGWSAASAGLWMGLLAATGIPLALTLPPVFARHPRPGSLLCGLLLCFPVAYVGLMVSPHDLAPIWAVILGIGGVTFPLVLTLIGLRARTAEGTAALSAFTQSVGYLVAATGPFLVGVVHGASGGWTVPLAVMCVLVLPLFALGAYIGRPAALEDQLASDSPRVLGSAHQG